MASPISIPRLGWNMDEGKFLGWIKHDGDEIAIDDALFTLEGEKATEDIASLTSGTLRILPGGPKVGDTVAVGTVIGQVLQEGEMVTVQIAPISVPAPSEASAAIKIAGPNSATPLHATKHGPKVSPRARRVAGELQVDWCKLRGSGSTGRIRERDVRAAASATPGATMNSTRRRIAQRLQESLRSTVPVTLLTTTDATHLVQLHQQFRAVGQQTGSPHPTFTDFLVKLAAGALKLHAELNARTHGTQIEVCSSVHIGVAVDADAGLLVPVIRNVPELSLKELAIRSRDLIARARLGQLKAKEMQDGTFTVTNLGRFGIDAFTPVLNPPQVAILGVGRIQRRPAVQEEKIVVRDELTLSLTFDHCAVDGAPAARFLQTLRARIENPGPWLNP